MELALYCPDCGYYEKEDDSIGRQGDFYTSVSVGNLFGELLAFQFAVWLAKHPEQKWQLVEAGAHDGRLAADVLAWLQKWRPQLFERIEYVICESSERRKAWQQKTLDNFTSKVRWIPGDLQSRASQFNGVIFANELLDAMPVHRLGWDLKRREWFEWGVAIAEDQFEWCRLRTAQVLNATEPSFQRLAGLPGELLDALPDEFTTEICPAAEKWWRDAANALHKGWLVTLDYGLGQDELLVPERTTGTLRAYHRHRLCADLLANAGEQDLTAHINFDAIQSAGETAGLKTERFSTQASFFGEIMKSFWPEAERHNSWTSKRGREFQTLVHPEHLGRAFRVLVQAR